MTKNARVAGSAPAETRRRSPRQLFREAKHRGREGKKLLRRGRRALSEAVREPISAALAELRAARRARDVDRTEAAIERLDPLVEQHLGRYRKSAFREYSESVGLAVLFALMLRAFVVEAFQIPSESMVPTLLVGDHLFVNKFVYGVRIPFTRFDIIDFGNPERGDVVVFIFPVEEVRTQTTIRNIMFHLDAFRRESGELSYPESLTAVGLESMTDDWGNGFRYERTSDREYVLTSAGPDGAFDTSDDLTNANTAIRPGQRACLTAQNLEDAKDYIKRVIALSGDRVRVENNIVYVNDEAILSEPLPPSEEGPTDRFGRLPTRRLEHHGNAEYVVQYYGSVPDFDEVTVRDGYIFVMGDNRDNSADSRCWGQVPIENVKGEAMFIFWSGGEGGRFLGNRWNRMLGAVD